MIRQFDEDAFLARSRDILVHSKGKTFGEAKAELEGLRREYAGISSARAKKFIRQHLSRRLLMLAIDTCQPPRVVDRLYARNIREGFVDVASELASALEYAYYCNDHGSSKKGLRVLQKISRAIRSSDEIPPDALPNFVKPIETCIFRLKQ